MIDNLRFCPAFYCKSLNRSFPALVAKIESHACEFMGVQLVLIDPKTKSKLDYPDVSAKLIFGTCKGGAIRLGDIGPKIIVCEGLEDGLTLKQYWDLPVWVGCGSNMANIIFPDVVQEVIIARDNDESGYVTCEKLSKRLKSEGKKVSVISPVDAKDFNEMHMKVGNHA